MKAFTRLYFDLDETNRTSQKLIALKSYFKNTAPADAAWALTFLAGDRLKRLIPRKLLRDWALQETGLPEWLLEESYDAVGDSAEALALLLPPATGQTDLPLNQLIQERLLPLASLPDDQRRDLLLKTWRSLDIREKLVWNKMITGEFRVGVSKTLVIRAVADVAGISPGVMAHRLMGSWSPTEANYLRLLNAEGQTQDITRPYPFYLAYPIEGSASDLGPVADWQVEWKWDGIRGQLIRRQAAGTDGAVVSLWSRGEELVTERFPEIRSSAHALPLGTVLDGEILAYKDGRPLPFGFLQHRIGRKSVGAKLQEDYPVVFMAYDVMELRGEDLRERPMTERRAILEDLIGKLPQPSALHLSPVLNAPDWPSVEAQFREARGLAVEGVMLKRKTSPYRVGRQKGDWWKWKTDPYHIDAVLIYAQQGHGRRASLYTDYTFGLWSEGKLVPIAKAYSGLSDEEIRSVDNFIRRNTTDRFGPVRVVKPELVFELAFEGIQASGRHKAGVAVRFPRMSRRRMDKKAEEADTLETLQKLIPKLPEKPPILKARSAHG